MGGDMKEEQGIPTCAEALMFACCRLLKTPRIAHLNVVELGCGYYSTPLLNAFTQEFGKTHHVFYEDGNWAEQFAKWRIECHAVIKPWLDIKLPQDTGLVLVDQEQYTKDRVKFLYQYQFKKVPLVVFHDWDKQKRQHEEELKRHYVHYREFTKLIPTTAVFSNMVAL
jgi:hypothetical protein